MREISIYYSQQREWTKNFSKNIYILIFFFFKKKKKGLNVYTQLATKKPEMTAPPDLRICSGTEVEDFCSHIYDQFMNGNNNLLNYWHLEGARIIAFQLFLFRDSYIYLCSPSPSLILFFSFSLDPPFLVFNYLPGSSPLFWHPFYLIMFFFLDIFTKKKKKNSN